MAEAPPYPLENPLAQATSQEVFDFRVFMAFILLWKESLHF